MRRFFGKLYVQVLIGVFAGVALGFFAPNLGSDFKPLGDVFIKLIKMVFAPIIFATVVLGIARMENMKELGRVGVRAFVYFEVLSTFALALGLVVVNVVRPGDSMNIDPAQLDTKAIATYTASAAKPTGFVDFMLNLVPTSIVDALAKNDILQILVFATMFGVALSHIGARGKPVVDFLDSFTHGVFSIVGMIMRLAPLAAFGAMAFTVGKYGLGSIVSLGKLMGTMYVTCILFVVLVLGGIARLSGFSLWKLLKYIKDELFTVLGTSSSESVVPQLMRKLEHAGVSKPVVGLVVPSGLTFNPDGQCIYYTMAAIFIAQATNTPLSLTDQLVVLGVLLPVPASSRWPPRSRRWARSRSPGWCSCSASTASCRRRVRSRTRSATRSAPSRSPAGSGRSIGSAWPRSSTARPIAKTCTSSTRATTHRATSSRSGRPRRRPEA
jgi:aerobic C4-dicarboxylate transport protein